MLLRPQLRLPERFLKATPEDGRQAANTHALEEWAALMAGRIRMVSRETDATAIQSDTTLTADDQLAFEVEANQRFVIPAFLIADSSTTADIKYGWSVPAGATMEWGALSTITARAAWLVLDPATAPTALLAAGDSLSASCGGVGTKIGHSLLATLTVGATGGPVALTWAQNTSGATDTKLRKNSCLLPLRLE